MLNLLVVAQYGLLLLIPLFLLRGSYRLLLHPLRKFPGPQLARLSDAYGGYYAWKRTLYLETWRDHLKYGPVIRQGPNKLVFNSVTALRDIYLNDKISKSTCYQAGNVNPTTTNVFDTIDKQVHRRKRRLVGAAVSDQSMRKFEPTMLNQVNIFLKEMLSSAQTPGSDPVNMSDRCKYLALDLSGLQAFGYNLNLQKSKKTRWLIPKMTSGSWRVNMYMQFPFLRKLKYERLTHAEALLVGQGYLITLTEMIKSRQAKQTHAMHDLYSCVAGTDNSNVPKKDKIELSEVWTEAIFFVSAAGDTISTALSALFFYLAHNPHCMHRLVDEIHLTFSSSDQIRTGPQLSGCRYLRACVDEAMRMSPPVPGTLWREHLPAQDGAEPWVIDGHVMPAGAQAGVNIYSLHHNEEYFSEPFVYRPERWLKGRMMARRKIAPILTTGRVQIELPLSLSRLAPGPAQARPWLIMRSGLLLPRRCGILTSMYPRVALMSRHV